MVDRVTISTDTGVTAAVGPNDAALIAKMDAKNGVPSQEANAESRPAWLPEKFESAEALAKAYAELEKSRGKKEESPAATPPAPKAEGQPADVTKAAEAAVADAGLDFNKLSEEVAKDGKLSDASVAALKAKGITQEVIDSHIAGLKAQVEVGLSKVHAIAGGADEFNAMITWAGASASEAQVKTYNDLVNTGDQGKIESAAQYLKTLYQSANGTQAARRVEGEANKNAGLGDVYESRAQMTADMRNPLYKSDPAFRDKVQAKLGRSTVI